MNEFQTDQDKQLDGSTFNATKKSSGFKTKRFFLDAMATRNDLNGNNYFPFPFKSFWVADTNNKNFSAKMIVNNKGDGGDPLPLRMNMSIPFEYRQAGCALEWPAQSGVWIDVVFAFDSNITPGFTTQDLSGVVSINEGDSFTESNPTITNAGTSVLCVVNPLRKIAQIQNKSGQPIWVGSIASLGSVDFKKKCRQIDAGYDYDWRNRGALYARVETGTTDSVHVMDEI